MSELANKVVVEVVTNYLEAQSDLLAERYVFSYTITVRNLSNTTVKLLSRRWLITDAEGKETEVEGEGVVGKQPEIAARTSFTYTSGSVFTTPIGTMQGHYQMIDANGSSFQVPIPVFRLAIPNLLN